MLKSDWQAGYDAGLAFGKSLEDIVFDLDDDVIGNRHRKHAHNFGNVQVSRIKVEHSCVSISGMIEPGSYCTTVADSPDFPFVARWLIVTTPGFFIEELKVGNESVLSDIDADIFYRANWDRLERLVQLDRVALREVPMSPSRRYLFRIRQHFGTKPREFRGAFIGQSSTREG